MTKYDVGKLKVGDRVKVIDDYGVVTNVHEPEWIDHKTRAFRKEFQSADIRFEGYDRSICIQACAIEML